MQDIEIDGCRVVHHVGIVFTGKNVTGSAHVSRQLIDFVEAAIDHMLHEVCITQIAQQKVISLCLAEPRELEIDTSDPEPFSLQSSHEMMTDKATRPTDQRSFATHCMARHCC